MRLRSQPFTVISIPFYLLVAYLVTAAYLGLPFGNLGLLAPTTWVEYLGFSLFFLGGAIVLPELVRRERKRAKPKNEVGTV